MPTGVSAGETRAPLLETGAGDERDSECSADGDRWWWALLPTGGVFGGAAFERRLPREKNDVAEKGTPTGYTHTHTEGRLQLKLERGRCVLAQWMKMVRNPSETHRSDPRKPNGLQKRISEKMSTKMSTFIDSFD